MRRKPTPWVVMALALSAVLTSTACAGGSEPDEAYPAAIVDEAAGSAPPLITLVEDGAERIGVQTAAVTSQSPLSVPYSALLYDPNGATWVYTVSAPLKYKRHPVTVKDIEGDRVLLTAGPPPGTEIVTVGVAELYGAELGIGQ